MCAEGWNPGRNFRKVFKQPTHGFKRDFMAVSIPSMSFPCFENSSVHADRETDKKQSMIVILGRRKYAIGESQ